MAKLDSLLFPVFDALRKQGVPLGVSDYLLAVKTIRSGFGLEDAARFKELCRLLWTKSKEDQELFDIAFAELIEPELQIVSTPELVTTTPINTSPSETPPSTISSESTLKNSKFQSQSQLESKTETLDEQVPFRPKSSRQLFSFKLDRVEQPRHYYFTMRLPISQREMAGIWRHLRHPQRTGVLEDLDVEGTIDSICRTGIFIRPRLQARRRNQAKLVVLIDQQGSMAPFTPLVNALIESIERGGLLGKVSLYYFHDCPEGFLYEHPSLTSPLSLEVVLNSQAKNNSVLIISDAGAACGYYDGTRLADTKAFIKTLGTYTYLYAWLNPMPPNRWLATTAEDIATIVPMFYLDKEGLNDAVNILRGHPFPSEVGIYE
jgi:uncharacterized protein